MSRTVDMTVGNPTKHLLSFAFPLLLANLGQQFYMIVDAAIVGRGVGVKALAAVGATDWSYWLILWSISGLTQGFSTFVSRHFGEKNYKELNKVVAMSALLCAVIGGTLTIAGIFAAKPLLLMLNTPEDIIGSAYTYLVTMVAGTIIVMAYNMSSSILRAFGDGRSPLIAMVIAATVNIGLDCLFVFVFEWGIFGAAIASVMSQFVSFVFCFLRVRTIEYIELCPEARKIDWSVVKDMLVFGLPIAIQYMIIAGGGIILQSSVNLQGSIFIAGYTATNKVYGLLECSATALGLACSTFFAQNYGAGKYERVKAGVKNASLIVFGLAALVLLFVHFTKRLLLQLFLDVNEAGGPEALEIGVHYLIIMAGFFVILFLIYVFRNALHAMEISVWSMISGIVEFFCRVFMAKVAINWIGSDALFISEPVAWFGALLCVMLPYFHYRKTLLCDGKNEARSTG